MTDRTPEFYHDIAEQELRDNPERLEDYVDIGWKTLYAVLAIFLAVMALS